MKWPVGAVKLTIGAVKFAAEAVKAAVGAVKWAPEAVKAAAAMVEAMDTEGFLPTAAARVVGAGLLVGMVAAVEVMGTAKDAAPWATETGGDMKCCCAGKGV